MTDKPWLNTLVAILLACWLSMNTGTIIWQMFLSVWLANVQSPQAIQQLQRQNAEVQRQLDAERAKTKSEAPK